MGRELEPVDVILRRMDNLGNTRDEVDLPDTSRMYRKEKRLAMQRGKLSALLPTQASLRRTTKEILENLKRNDHEKSQLALSDTDDWFLEDCRKYGYPGECVRREDYYDPCGF